MAAPTVPARHHDASTWQPLITADNRLYHALELWDWFALIGETAPLDSIAEDIRGLASS